MNEICRIAVCQLRTELDSAETMKKAALFIRSAAESGADFAVLPEMFNCPYSSRYFRSFAARGHERALEEMAGWARDNHIWLVGGSVPETEGEKLYNTCFVFDREGRLAAKHRKIHLFDVDIPGMRFRESATFSPGRRLLSLKPSSARWARRSALTCVFRSCSGPWRCAGQGSFFCLRSST